MDKEHQEKIKRGRDEGMAVKRYLMALAGENPSPKRDVSKQLERIKEELQIVTNPLQRVELLRKQYNLTHDVVETMIDLNALEKKFVEVLPDYSERTGTVRAVWEEVGVPKEVLDRAGV